MTLVAGKAQRHEARGLMVVAGSKNRWEGGKGSGILNTKGNRLDGCQGCPSLIRLGNEVS